MHDRRRLWPPGELVPTWHAPTVCIQKARTLPTKSLDVMALVGLGGFILALVSTSRSAPGGM